MTIEGNVLYSAIIPTPTPINVTDSEMKGKMIVKIYTSFGTVAAVDSNNNTYMWGLMDTGMYANHLGPTPHTLTTSYRGVSQPDKLNINTTLIGLIAYTAFGSSESSYYVWYVFT